MPADREPDAHPSRIAKRRYGTGSVFQKRNAWYGQWRVRDRLVTRKLGPIRAPGTRDGLTRKMAEARLRQLMGEVAPLPVPERMTVAEAGERLIRQLGRKVSTLTAYRSQLRVHLAPHFGEKPLVRIEKDDVEEFVLVCLDRGQSVKSVKNYVGLLHGIFEFALRQGWVVANPCRTAEKPAAPETDALLAAAVNPRGRRKPVRARRVKQLRDAEGMSWKAIAAELAMAESTAIYLYRLDLGPLDADDALGRVERALYLTAAMTGMRRVSCSPCVGWTSTGSRTACACGATTSTVGSAPPSPSAPRGASRWRTRWRASSSCCSRPRRIRPTRTSCSDTPTRGGRSTARARSSASRLRSPGQACARFAPTT
jgi:predicted transcriptional regulator